MKNQSKYKETVNITAVERALRVMETLYDEGREMGIKELALKMGEYQSTVYRVVSTLEAHGYIYQNTENARYGISYKLYMLGKRVEKDSALIKIVKPYAEAIAKEFSETVNVAIRDNSRSGGYYAITLYQARGNNRALGVSESIGQSYDCYSNGVGKVLMAFSDDLNMSMIKNLKLVSYTPYTIVDNGEFVRELEKICEQGYGIDNQERELGLFCVSCPVLDHKGKAVVAISVSGYENSVKSHGVDNIVKSLKEACAEISNLII